ncbi:noggin-like [Physella acuta]|uniref:noggin-like n=1 Tax=Physella acuta TaxID=109671 RepID=UPI0027DABE42|nr:noggin-like [Physella acuta]
MLSMLAVVLVLHALAGITCSLQTKPAHDGTSLAQTLFGGNFQQLTPGTKDLKPKKLMRRLGKDFNAFWMSTELPHDLLKLHVQAKTDSALIPDLESTNLQALEQTLRAKYGRDNVSGDDGGVDAVDQLAGGGDLVEHVMRLVQTWLVEKASCRVYYQWEDLGLLFWPRWIKRGLCQPPEGALHTMAAPKPAACSWPPGMHCVAAKPKTIQVLRWACRYKPIRRLDRKPRSTVAENGSRNNTHHETPNFDLVKYRIQNSNGSDTHVTMRPNTFIHLLSRHEGRSSGRKDEYNETEDEKKRGTTMKCKWEKIKLPVTDECFCSC